MFAYEYKTPKLRTKTNELLEDTFSSLENDEKVFIVGLCGGQGGGKTKLSKTLCKNIKNSEIIEERNFFKPITNEGRQSPLDEPLIGEFGGYSKDRKLLLVELSNPKSYDYDKLYNTLKDLKDGKTVYINKFNEQEGKYSDIQIEINPEKIDLVIIEGYFLFLDQKVRDLINLKMYVEIDDDVRLSRLIINEQSLLNNNPVAFKYFFMIYEKYIKYAYDHYIAPTKKYAKIILPNYAVKESENQNENENETIESDETLDMLVNNLQNIAARRHKKKAIKS